MSPALTYATPFPHRDLLLNPFVNENTSKTILISLCGAGGKTSTLRWLAHQFYQQQKKVLITTTTQMFIPAENMYQHLIIEDNTNQQQQRCLDAVATAQNGCLVALFNHVDRRNGKVVGLTAKQLDNLKMQHYFDIMLVEADGAHRHLFKVPADHEPAIPSLSDWVIAVIGGAMIGAISDPNTIHRWSQLQKISNIVAGETLDWPLFDRLLRHPLGIFKGTPTDAGKIWFINGDYQHETLWYNHLLHLLSRHRDIFALWQGAILEPLPIRQLFRHRHDSPHHPI